MTIGRIVLAVLLLGAPALMAQDVLVVDKDQAPGWEYLSIQAAVDAAQPGDIVLVRGGTYYDESLKIIGKGLTLIGDIPGGVVLLEGVTIRDLPAGQTVLLRGLWIQPDSWWANQDKYGVRASSCAGSIRLELCTLLAFYWGGVKRLSSPVYEGLGLTDCASCVLVDCTVRGGAPQYNNSNGSAGDALLSLSSRVIAFGCTFTGQDAVPTLSPAPDAGGDGASLQGGSLYAADCRFIGGSSPDACAAGLGIVADSTSLVLIDTTSESTACGPPTSLSDCALLELPGPRRELFMQSPKREGELLWVVADGEPGEAVLLLISLGTLDIFAPSLHAPLLVSLSPALLVPLGTTDANGYLGPFLAVSPLPATLQGVSLYCQAAFQSGAGSRLSNPTTVVVLDAAL
jgi:hypothetical protein